jgi:cleavage and polyadenylation specificity factor subunit 3
LHFFLFVYRYVSVFLYVHIYICRGVRFTPTAAGHVLGAAMFSIEIDGIKVLYTGDYSMEEDRHLMCAEVPPGGSPDVLIVESTFGVVTLPAREEREAKFTSTVEDVVTRGGSCLIPVFALGRAQELLLILDEYWQTHPELQNIPVFYASKLASKALRVYQTFVNMMNDHIRGLMDISNPFKLNHIKNMLRSEFDILGPCVVMAAPGFMQVHMCIYEYMYVYMYIYVCIHKYIHICIYD